MSPLPSTLRRSAVAEQSPRKRMRDRWKAALEIRTTPSAMAHRLRWVQMMLGLVVGYYFIQAIVCEYEIACYIDFAAVLGWSTVEYCRTRLSRVELASRIVVGVTILIVAGTAMVDGQSGSAALWFFPVVPLMAGQLLGNRAVLQSAAASFAAVGVVMLSEQLVQIPREYPNSSEDLLILRIVVLLVCCGVAISAKRSFGQQMAELDRQAQELNQLRLDRDEARRSSSVFLGSMSSHVRAPMAQLVARTESIKLRAGEEKIELTSDLVQCANRVSRLVHDILDLSDLENGRLGLYPTTFGLEEFVSELQAWFDEQEAPKPTLRFDLSDQNLQLTLDRPRLYQICTRLMENALHFSQANTLVVSIRVQALADGQGQIFVRVTDDGIGISPACQKQVMERFAFYCDTQANQDKGAGISLVLIRQLVRAMGGEVSFDEAPEQQGTSVLVQLRAELPSRTLLAAA